MPVFEAKRPKEDFSILDIISEIDEPLRTQGASEQKRFVTGALPQLQNRRSSCKMLEPTPRGIKNSPQHPFDDELFTTGKKPRNNRR